MANATRDIATNVISLDSLPPDLASCGCLLSLHCQWTLAYSVYLLNVSVCVQETCEFVFQNARNQY